MARANELRAQLMEVVNLAIEGDPDRLVFVAHGLMCGRREINDREPPVLQAHPHGAWRQGKVLEAGIVRAAVAQLQAATFTCRRAADLSKNSAHKLFFCNPELALFASEGFHISTPAPVPLHAQTRVRVRVPEPSPALPPSRSIIKPRTTQASSAQRKPLTSMYSHRSPKKFTTNTQPIIRANPSPTACRNGSCATFHSFSPRRAAFARMKINNSRPTTPISTNTFRK